MWRTAPRSFDSSSERAAAGLSGGYAAGLAASSTGLGALQLLSQSMVRLLWVLDGSNTTGLYSSVVLSLHGKLQHRNLLAMSCWFVLKPTLDMAPCLHFAPSVLKLHACDMSVLLPCKLPAGGRGAWCNTLQNPVAGAFRWWALRCRRCTAPCAAGASAAAASSEERRVSFAPRTGSDAERMYSAASLINIITFAFGGHSVLLEI